MTTASSVAGEAAKRLSRQLTTKIPVRSFDHLKCVLLGDKCTDKTRLIMEYTLGEQNTTRLEGNEMFDSFHSTVELDGNLVELDLWDVNIDPKGKEDVDSITWFFSQADLYLLFFSVGDRESLSNITKHWVREVCFHAPTKVWVLVATHCEQRGETGRDCVSEKEMKDAAAQIGASTCIEMNETVTTASLFEKVMKIALADGAGVGKSRQKLVERIMIEEGEEYNRLRSQLQGAEKGGDKQKEAIEGLKSKVESKKRQMEEWSNVKDVVKQYLEKEGKDEHGSCSVM